MIPSALHIIAFLCLIPYIVLIIWVSLGWFKLRTTMQPTSPAKLPCVSVVVALRNEENNLPALIQALTRQNYPAGNFEIIFADDESEDNSRSLILEQALIHSHIKLIPHGPEEKPGKKAAIARGIRFAKGDIVITTDADCRMGNNWITTLVQALSANNTRMVLAPVDIEDKGGNLLSHLQSLEFMSLTGTTAGSAAMHHPLMGNAANMAFCRQTYLDIIDRVKGNTFASGDDMFLLQAIKKRYPGQISFVFSKDAMVVTQPAPGIREFFSQRIRWASKAPAYHDSVILLAGLSVAAFNLLLSLGVIISALFYTGWLPFMGGLWLAKAVADFPLLLSVSRFFGKERLMRWYLPLQLMYPFYVSGTLILALFSKPAWRGRPLKKT